MPNWCVNEVKLDTSWTLGDNVQVMLIEKVHDFLKETIPNYERRVRMIDTAQDKRGKSKWDRKIEERLLLDFNSVVPYPQEFRQRDEDAADPGISDKEFFDKYPPTPQEMLRDGKRWRVDGYNAGGYAWCCANWGTKWNACDVVWIPSRNMYIFDTPWNAPYGVLSALHQQFPDLHIRLEYFERGMSMIGGCEYLPESAWDESDFYYENVSSMAQYKAQADAFEEKVKARMEEEKNTILGHIEELPPTIGKGKGKLRLVPGFSEGLTPKSSSTWEAGRAYNSWSADYFGFKGG